MIEVILLERIERLGQMGQTVKVRPGFARNFLLPQKKALRATKTNLELFEKQREQMEAKNAAERAVAQSHAETIDGLTFVIIRQASETGQLYGSVSARDVSDAAQEAKQKISRPQVVIDQPIKTIGLFPVKIRLHPEVTVKIMINVARSPEEAVVQVDKHTATKKASAEKAKVETAFGAPVTEGEEAEEHAKAKKPAKKATKAKAHADEDEAEEKAAKPKAAKKPAAKKAAKK